MAACASPCRRGSCATGWRRITPTACARCGMPRTRAITAVEIVVAGGGRRPTAESRRARRAARREADAEPTKRTSARRSIRASPSRISSSASPTSWRMPPRAASPKPRSARPRGAVQSAVPLWRRRARQDPSHACDRLAHPDPRARAQGDLSLRREIHVPVHPRAALQGHDGVQGAVPLGRRADDRRRAVHQRQGFDPGRVLPHLQRAGRPEPADHHLRRQVALRPRGHGGAHALAARLGPGRRHPSDHLRAAPRHPAGQGRAAAGARCRTRCWSSSPTRSPPTCASSKAR